MKIKTYIGALCALLLLGCATSNHSVTQLPLDPNWHSGKLATGFTYHIMPVDETSDRIQLYLRVKAGSIHETDQQQGYAHLLEHMAFNGTKNFPQNDIIRLFEKAGLEFGRDINAYTSFESTVYTLNIHEENTQLLNQVLRYFADVSMNIKLDKAEIDKEIGIVQGEIHNRANIYKIPQIAYMENFSKDTKYQYKKIAGTLDSIENATVEGLNDYYQTWYHPENIELFIVGNVKKEATINLVNEHFSAFTRENKFQKKAPQLIPNFSQTPFSMTSEQVEIDSAALVFNLPDYQYQTYEDDYQYRLTKLTNELINYRLSRSNELLKTPFNESFSYIGTPTEAGNKWVYSLGVKHDVGLADRATEFLAMEVARVDQHGFTEAEFNLQTKRLASEISTIVLDNSSKTSADIINTSMHNQTHNKVSISPAVEKQLANEFLAKVTLNEVNHFATSILVAPQFSAFYTWGSGKPNAEKIMADVKQTLLTEQTPPNAHLVSPSTALITNLPSPVK